MNSKSVEKKEFPKRKRKSWSSNLEFARGQFGGIKGSSNHKEQWESLQVSLNSLGGSEKTVDQWKKCWIDLKSGVKKSVNARRAFMNKTGGGSFAEVPRDLNPLEEEILQVMTVDAVDGDSCTPESGLQVEDTFEEFESVESAKKAKKVHQPARSTSISKGTSEYLNALEEARESQRALMDRLDKIEKQNEQILQKLDIILKK